MAYDDYNQAVGNVPFGNAFLVQTPYTDRVTAALQAQQADRRKYEMGVTQHVDEQMNKELANVRSIDMPTVLDGYNKWKEISMQMLRPGVQNDPRAYNRLQIEKNAALGQTMAAINKSSQLNANMKELVAERKSKPSLYNDDFGDRVAAYNNTPMDQLAEHPKYGDLTNPDAFRYRGSQTDFGKLEQVASGQTKPVAGAETVEKLNDLQTRYTPVQFGNTPAQFFDNMKGQLAQHIPGRDAAAAWEAIPDQQRAYVDQQYAAISPDKWRQMTGTDRPQVIAPTDPNNPAEQYAAYRAKLYAINAAPRAGAPRVETNAAAKIKMQAALSLNRQEIMQAIRTNDKEKLMGVAHQYKSLDRHEQSQVLDQTMNDILDGGTKDADGNEKPADAFRERPDGTVSKEYKVPIGNNLKRQLSVVNPEDPKHRAEPDDLFYDEKNKVITPIFYVPGQPHTLTNIDRSLSKPMTLAEFRALVGKTYFGTREAAKESGTPGQTPAAGASGIKWQ